MPTVPPEIFPTTATIYANALQRFNKDQLADTAFMQVVAADAIQHAYFLHNIISATEPPTIPAVVDTPYLSQDGPFLSCTMGNWTGTPSTYSYEWTIGDAVNAASGPTWELVADDVGTSASCTVTASNFLGSTTAPPSNTITIQEFTNP